MHLVELTTPYTDKKRKSPIFVNPTRVVSVCSEKGGSLVLLSGEDYVHVTEALAEVVEKINKAMAVPVAMVVPNLPGPGALALPPGMRR